MSFYFTDDDGYSDDEDSDSLSNMLFDDFPYKDDLESIDITDDLVATFNIRGSIFQTLHSTIFKSTHYVGRLHNHVYLKRHYDEENNEYFFDRDPRAFRVVLNYLRTGFLHVQLDLCYPLLKVELEYWGVPIKALEPCCWFKFSTQRKSLDNLKRLENELQPSYKFPNKLSLPPDLDTPLQRMKNRVWVLMSDHSSSRSAVAYAILSFTVVAVSVILICIKTVPFDVLTREGDVRVDNDTILRSPRDLDVAKSTADFLGCHVKDDALFVQNYRNECVYQSNICMLEFACLMFFTIEFFVGVLACPSKLEFLTDKLVIVDLVALVPDYIQLIVRLTDDPVSHPTWCMTAYDEFIDGWCIEHKDDLHRVFDTLPNSTAIPKDFCSSVGSSYFRRFDVLNLFRLCRVMRLLRRVPGMWIALYTIRTSMKELLLIMGLILISTYMFAAFTHFLEQDNPQLDSIPESSWFAIITVCTIGYGDVVPRTGWGKVVGCFCSITGSFLLSLTIPTLITNFMSMFHNIKYMIFKECAYLNRGRHTSTAEQRDNRKRRANRVVSMALGTMYPVLGFDSEEEDDEGSGSGTSTSVDQMEQRESVCKSVDPFSFLAGQRMSVDARKFSRRQTFGQTLGPASFPPHKCSC